MHAEVEKVQDKEGEECGQFGESEFGRGLVLRQELLGDRQSVVMHELVPGDPPAHFEEDNGDVEGEVHRHSAVGR